MRSLIDNDPIPADHRIAAYPALARLQLDDADVSALSSQGFVSREQRDGRTYFKLRFRRAGRQIVRYVGDANHAVDVKNELSALQTEARIMRQLKILTKTTNQQLREVKKQLQPILEAHGWAFHGLAIRRPRMR